MKRVVVTGVGAVTPLGINVKSTWSNVLAGKSGISKIDQFNTDDLSVKIAGQINFGKGENQFDPDKFLAIKDQKKVDRFIMYALGAAQEALEDSGWFPTEEEDLLNTGVLVGSGIGGLGKLEESGLILATKGPSRISPFLIPSLLINLASGHVSMKYGFLGPNNATVSACATSTNAIGDAARIIANGDAKVIVAGGAESGICRLGIAGFSSARALASNFNDAPEKANRPWDRDRDGFVMSDGAGIVILEELEHAQKRGAKIYGEIIGYGMSSDAYHITAPHPEGKGAIAAMKMALKNSQMNIEDIDYINAHATSTPLGDVGELNAVRKLFGDHVYKFLMSSTKSSIGHMLGAAGVIEAIFCLLAMRDSIVPATLNLDNPVEECDKINLVPHVPIERKINTTLSNSFGFGGCNACLILNKFTG